MVHIIKVYFTGPKQNVQIRRLAVNSEVVSRFELLARKIQEMFPGLAQGHIEVTWIDSEKDVIHMSSDEELAQALASADDDILRIYAKCLDDQQIADRENKNFKSSHNEIHQNVICDGCDKTISGYRYKCLQCRNFDLCSQCNATNKHENHDMIKLVRPSHISREWVFPGARKIWRSMFGRCPYTFTAPTSNENEHTPKSDSKKTQWPEIFEELLKGGYVSADKLIKENLGGFLNFIESVSGGLDIKLENGPHKARGCMGKQDVKMDEKTNHGSSNENPKSTAGPSNPKVVPLKECLKLMKSKISEQSSDSAASGDVKQEETESSAKLCDLIHNIDFNQKFDKLPEEQNSAEQKEMENFTKPCGLFGDNESADGWTILNKQEDEKKDIESVNNNGAIPKNPNLYPLIFEKVQSWESSPNAETKVKEVSSKQADHAQVLPAVVKDAESAENNIDKHASLKKNENDTANYDPEIMNALVKMQAMGFTNEGGWLERLLITKDGNINATLDALYPNARRH